MIREITGDLLRDGKGVLCHQVNYQGVMGGGIALSIREKLLSPSQYAEYVNACMACGRGLLGEVQYFDCGAVTVANMFCQNDFVTREDAPFTPAGCVSVLTNYGAMEECFTRVRDYAYQHRLPVSVPAYIGCGIAGGDWDRVGGIIRDVFARSPVDATVIYWEREWGRTR